MALSKIFVAPKNGQGGVKKSKKNFFQKKYSKDGKKNLGTSGTIFAKNRFFEIRGSGGGSDPRLLPLGTCLGFAKKFGDLSTRNFHKLKFLHMKF